AGCRRARGGSALAGDRGDPGPSRGGRQLGAIDGRHATGGGGQPEVDRAGAGGVAPAAREHPDLASPQVPVARLDPLPAGAGDAQPHRGPLGPATAEDDEDGAPLPGPGGEAAGRGGGHAAVGSHDDAVEPVDEGGGHAPPLAALGGGDEDEALEGHAELVGGDESEGGQADGGHPGPGLGGGGHEGEGEGGGAARGLAGDADGGAPAQALPRQQGGQRGQDREVVLPAQGEGADPLGQ